MASRGGPETRSRDQSSVEFDALSRWQLLETLSRNAGESTRSFDGRKSDVNLPACIECAPRNEGGFQFSVVTGEIDYRVSTEADGSMIERMWAGDDDGSETAAPDEPRVTIVRTW